MFGFLDFRPTRRHDCRNAPLARHSVWGFAFWRHPLRRFARNKANCRQDNSGSDRTPVKLILDGNCSIIVFVCVCVFLPGFVSVHLSGQKRCFARLASTTCYVEAATAGQIRCICRSVCLCVREKGSNGGTKRAKELFNRRWLLRNRLPHYWSSLYLSLCLFGENVPSQFHWKPFSPTR